VATFVALCLALEAEKSSLADAAVAVNVVDARAAVLARIRLAFVDVLAAIDVPEASQTFTNKAPTGFFVANAIVLAGVASAGHNRLIAASARESGVASTPETVDEIFAPAVAAVARATIVDVGLAGITLEAVNARAAIPCHHVGTLASILARVGLALVHLRVARNTKVARRAGALEVTRHVQARGTVGART